MNSAAIRPQLSDQEPETILLLEHDVLTRAFLADYLRSCGYRVFEARGTAEALTILQESAEPIRVVLSDAENGFRLSGWVKANRPKTRVILAATPDRAAHAAADLCDVGPHRKRPYDPQLLVQKIKASLAKRED
jgi:response regulator RpfG family c-di-GMP phosphodiesterase